MKRFISILLSIIVVTACFVSTVPAYAKINATDYGAVKGYQETNPKKYEGETDKTKFVYYPTELETTDKQYPVIVWANGTSCPPALYAKLFKAFAEKGFVVVASSETMSANGKEQIACANYVINRSNDETSVLYNKIATNKIVAMGHSQGGRSTVNAVSSSDLFCCAVSIAGSNLKDEARKNNAPTLFFTGTKDWIVPADDWVVPAYNLANGPAAYASYKGAVHTTCTVDVEPYVNYSIQWIDIFANGDENALKLFLSSKGLAGDEKWTDFQYKNLDNQIYSATVISNGNIIIIASFGGIIIFAGIVIFMVYRKKEKKS